MTDDFEKLCSYLSSFNLENLALSSSLISSMEYYNNWPNDYAYFMPIG
jgi:histidyl-tRNA synthetase